MKELLALILAAIVLAGIFGAQAAYARPGNTERSVPSKCEGGCDC